MSNYVCNFPSCPYNEDGRCLEGRELDCPNLTSALPSEPAANAVSDQSTTYDVPSLPEHRRGLELYSGEPLGLEEARELARSRPTISVSLVGLIESGKTSLLARIHQMLQSGPINSLTFKGSLTLPRFEQLNWKATIESRNNAPTMDRSARGFDNSFLHIELCPNRRQIGTHLLLNDISGETVVDAVPAQEVCESLICLGRADHLVAVIDGATLNDASERHHHLSNLRDFIQRVVQTGQVGKQTFLHVVIAKRDRLADQPAAARAEDMFRVFEAHFGGVKFWRIAARPMDGSMPTETEIAELVEDWLSWRPESSRSIISADTIPWSRDFARYGAGIVAKETGRV